MYKELIDYFGNLNNMARQLKISHVAIQRWELIPPRRAFEIERLTKGKFKYEELVKINFLKYKQKRIQKRGKK